MRTCSLLAGPASECAQHLDGLQPSDLATGRLHPVRILPVPPDRGASPLALACTIGVALLIQTLILNSIPMRQTNAAHFSDLISAFYVVLHCFTSAPYSLFVVGTLLASSICL